MMPIFPIKFSDHVSGLGDKNFVMKHRIQELIVIIVNFGAFQQGFGMI